MNNSIHNDHFSFTKKERNAVAILIGIAIISILITYLYSPLFTKPFVNQDLQAQLSALQNSSNETQAPAAQEEASAQDAQTDPPTDPVAQLHPFGFDPNTLDATGLSELGLSNTIVRSVLSFRNNGGQFNTPNDLRKVDGLSKAAADALVPYIHIRTQKTVVEKTENAKQDLAEPVTPATSTSKIDINTATAEAWKTLPGIGDVLSNRIVKFKNAMHGFRSVEDVRKTYGLSDSVYRAILPFLMIGDIENK